MGITIHYRLAQKTKNVKSTLDYAEETAKLIKEHQADKLGVDFSIERRSENVLAVDIAGCETLLFYFGAIKEYEEDEQRNNWSYELSTLKDHYKSMFGEDYLWSSGFCKTQYTNSSVGHKWVADLIKVVATRCVIAQVHDEGDYYHTGKLEDAIEAIESLGQDIDILRDKLVDSFGEDSVVSGGETKIKKNKPKKRSQ